LDRDAWEKRAPCLYLVRGSDDGFRYAGISKNRLKDRWRLSPAYDETGSRSHGVNHHFHSRCWPEMEIEFERKPRPHFEVRVAFVPVLRALLARAADQRSEIPLLSRFDDAVPAAIENWLRRNRRVTFGVSFLPWNKN
jgi:hypothetical protein